MGDRPADLVFPTVSVAGFYRLEPEWMRFLLIGLVVLIALARIAWSMLKARQATAALRWAAPGRSRPAAAAPGPPAAGRSVPQTRGAESGAAPASVSRNSGSCASPLRHREALASSADTGARLPAVSLRAALGRVSSGAGAGKTTATGQLGLRFPLADRLGREAVRGVGGTRNC